MILSTLLTAKAAAALLGAGTLVVGGTAAAYAGVLPSPLQSVAHSVVGAPAADQDDQDDQGEDEDGGRATPSATPSQPSESGEPIESPESDEAPGPSETPDPSTSPSAHGPDATGPAAHGLCTAHEHGGLPDHSTAGKALIAAAGSLSVDDYCATVLDPSATPTASSSESSTRETTAGPTRGSAHGKGHGKGHGKKNPGPTHPHG